MNFRAAMGGDKQQISAPLGAREVGLCLLPMLALAATIAVWAVQVSRPRLEST